MKEPSNQPQRQASTVLAIAQGAGLLALLHLLAIAGLWVLFYLADLIFYITSGIPNSQATEQLYQIWVFVLVAFGLVQWLYVLPVVWWLQQRKKPAMVQGMVGGAIFTALLNGSYFLGGHLL